MPTRAWFGLLCCSVACFGEAIAVPSYIYPGSAWDQLAAASAVTGLTIINPNSGPGTSIDQNYVNQVKKSKAAGLQVIGYVYTSYAARSLQQVESAVDLYYSWYGVDGIFFDEASADCANQAYYAALNAYVKAKGGKGITAINPGQTTPECYVNASDIIVNFEGAYSDYLNWNVTWESKYSPTKFWHLVYAAPSITEATNAIHLAKSRGAAWVYATDQTLPNPWGALASYWTQEVAAVQAISPLVASSVTPSTGTGLQSTFSFLSTDPNGAADLQVVYLDFGPSIFAAHSCIVAYAQAGNALFLFDDTSAGVTGPITGGGSATLSNSQCTLSGGGGVANAAGPNFVIPLAITFTSAFNGSQNVYGSAQSYSGANGGWQTLGSWTVNALAPAAVSVNPVNGGGSGPQTFNALYADQNGAADLQVVYVDFGRSIFAPHSCIAAYARPGNTLYLFNDATTDVTGSMQLGSNATLSNSQCKLTGRGTATLSGNNLTVPFTLTFLAGFSGSENVYGLAQSFTGASGGSQMLGNWTTGNAPLSASSVSPSGGGGRGPQAFRAVYTDPNGAADLQVVYLDFGSAVFAPNSCILAYAQAAQGLYLFNDATTAALGPVTAGGGATLSNSQCTLSASSGTGALAGNNLAIAFNLTFTNGFSGSKGIYGLAQNYAGANGGWQTLGAWTP